MLQKNVIMGVYMVTIGLGIQLLKAIILYSPLFFRYSVERETYMSQLS